MKKKSVVVMIGLLVGAAILVFNLNQCSGSQGGHIKRAEKTSFAEVTSQLDPGGSFYLYLSTERIITAVEEFATGLRQMVATNFSSSSAADQEELKVFDFIHGLVRNCGLMDISGLGVSSIPLGESLNHSKVVVHHYKEKGNGLIWQLMEGKPHDLTQLQLLPADTVMAAFTECKINVLWEWIKKQTEASGLDKVKRGLYSVEPMLQQQGIQLVRLLDSITGMGYVFCLDSQNLRAIPLGKMTAEIPEPSLAIMFSVKDDYAFNLLQSKLPMAQKSEEKNIKKLRIPIPGPPLPITLEPVIVQKGGMLIFASNSKIVEAMWAAEAKGSGLVSTKEFKGLSVHMPTQGNSFRFLSSRFLQTLLGIQKKRLAMSGEAGDQDAPLMKIFNMFPKEMALYAVLQNSAEGSVTTLNHTMGLESLILLPATVVTGIVAAIAVPNFLTAAQKGKQKATMGDMRSIAAAVESYMVDNGKVPEGQTLAELKNSLEPFYIKVLPLKDAWGNDFYYYHGTGSDKEKYAVGSGGKDGIFNGWEQTGFYWVTRVEEFNNDIILANGQFTYGPHVK
jgi:type II secretory pathway pseudopilin PulG